MHVVRYVHCNRYFQRVKINPNRNEARGALKNFVSTKQAAEMLGYSHRSGTIARLIGEGQLEAEHGPGNTILVYLDSVQRFAKHQLAPHITRVGRPRAKPER